ncbi:MAG: hypothetical protein ACPGO3_08055 [Magnetospiraceae bacterium]
MAHKVVYIACLSFSGSTLLSFALTNHSRMFTVGHTVGFPFPDHEDFFCSCGQRLQECAFFSQMKTTFEAKGLPFAYNEFGTNYRAVDNERLNWWLTFSLPRVQSNFLEHTRDAALNALPPFKGRLAAQDAANALFIDTALAFSKADVYVDNSHSPYRWRRLRRIPSLDLFPVQLYRDFRGVTLSHMRNKSMGAEESVRKWIDSHLNVIRVFSEAEDYTQIYYEDFCADPENGLGPLFRKLGLTWEPLPDDLSQTEHHILGNSMRESGIRIKLDTKWVKGFTLEQRNLVEGVAQDFVRKDKNHPLSQVITYYLDTFRAD